MTNQTSELRADLHRYIDLLDDKFIAVVHAMVDTYIEQHKDDPIIGYDINGKPMHASEAKAEFKRRNQAIDDGDFITIEQLKKESKKWLKEDTK